MSIPATIEAVTPAWLAHALAADAAIRRIDRQRLGIEYGGAPETYRLSLSYEESRPPESAAPLSLIAKLPQPDGNPNIYRREIFFYSRLAARSPVPTPRCYFAECDAAGNGLLLIEDLGHDGIGDMLEGATDAQARAAVENLAALHASWWESAELMETDWLAPTLPPDDLLSDKVRQRSQEAWQDFASRFAESIPPALKNAWSELARHRDRIRARAAVLLQTLNHGDYHLENLYFGPTGTRTRPIAFDWQLTRRGPGTRDLAWFMFWNLDPQTRRQTEEELLQVYCQGLVQGGVTGYTPEECLHGYRLALYEKVLPTLVEVASLVDLSKPRVAALAAAVTERVGAAVADHPLADLLD